MDRTPARNIQKVKTCFLLHVLRRLFLLPFLLFYMVSIIAVTVDLWLLSRIGPIVRHHVYRYYTLLLIGFTVMMISGILFVTFTGHLIPVKRDSIIIEAVHTVDEPLNLPSIDDATENTPTQLIKDMSNCGKCDPHLDDMTNELLESIFGSDRMKELNKPDSVSAVGDCQTSLMEVQLRMEYLEGESKRIGSKMTQIVEVIEKRDDEMTSNPLQPFSSKEEFDRHVIHTLDLREEVEKLKIDIETNKQKTVGLNEEYFISLIRKELALYDADHLGLADYALLTTGGQIIKCSPTYTKHSRRWFLYGIIPLWHVVASPSTVIQPGRRPGDCWPMLGSSGHIRIQLSRPITPTAFSLEHIPKSITPSGSMESAPKRFSVHGWQLENDRGTWLGTYEYNEHGPPLQKFPVQALSVGVYLVVDLQIHSNHGHPHFTCVYRFRVHGTPDQASPLNY